MHSIYIRPGGIANDLPRMLLEDIYKFLSTFNARINEFEEMLTIIGFGGNV